MVDRTLLARTLALASGFLDGLPERRVAPLVERSDLWEALGGGTPLPEHGVEPLAVVDQLAAAAEGGLMASPGPRFFGFVIGGALPAALAADWLASAWDQNAGLYATSPASSVVEEVASAWLLEALGLPEEASVGFVTGGQGANFTCLAAARHDVLARAGWDVEADGLRGSPPIDVVVGDDVHVTIPIALRLLGLGTDAARRVAADDQGRMEPEALRRALAETDGPAIVCAQAGDVNTGAFDPLPAIADAAEERGAWLHVDGAFGLWARSSPARRHLAEGAERADSWATDAHKWLNVPYDCGLAIVRDREAHRAAMGASAAYLAPGARGQRDPFEYTPEFSRRARGFAVYAALRSLGRDGLADLVERSCRQARLMAGRLGADEHVTVLNEVVLNQVLVRFDGPGEEDLTRAVIAEVQREGTLWLGGTTWQGAPAMRISFSNWTTSDADVELSASAILASAERARAARGIPRATRAGG